ncbi:MAG: ribosome biogenesis GTPase YlqF [Clostridiales Family XIII bacterium]|jgi:ribosome biogenesis GTPase A|nr:ribosome biogenesis GTPase YlqF [Clostridiales Family XIII bacterium]
MEAKDINWYPGHMKKTRELIQESMRLVDAALEVIDARIPVSSRNPIIDELTRGRRRLVILNKSDLSDAGENARWEAFFSGRGDLPILMNCVSGEGARSLLRALDAVRAEREAAGRRRRPLRVMAVGIPNVGKSSLINRLVGRKSAKTGDRPGITRGKQWLALGNGTQLLDTPGILWPKFEDPAVGLNLAFCGSVRDETMDAEWLALELVRTLADGYWGLLSARYGLEGAAGDDARATMEAIALRRGFLLQGRRVDCARAARTLLDEFRGGLIGRITLEKHGG